MATAWFYSVDGNKQGPVSSKQLADLARNGTLKPTDLVRKDGTQSLWVPAQKVKRLFQASSTPVLPPAGPPPLTDCSGVPSTPSRPVDPAPLRDTTTPPRPSARLQATPPPLPVATRPNRQAPTAVADSPTPRHRPEGESRAKVLVEVLASYAGGHPAHFEKATGRLVLTDTGVFFVDDEKRFDIQAPFERVRDISEPGLGSFPRELVKKAEKSKQLASLGTGAARLTGSLIGGFGGWVTRAVARSASGAVHARSALGPPPKNRLTVVLVDGGAVHKVSFDLGGADRQEIERATESFRSRVVAARQKLVAAVPIPALPGSRPPGQTLAGGMPQTGSFRLMSQGGDIGPIPGNELAARIRDGRLADTDMVSVETWLPVATIRALLGLSAPGLGTAGTGYRAMNQRSTSSAPSQAGLSLAGPMLAAYVGSSRHGRIDAVAMDRDEDGRIDAVAMDRDGDGLIDAVALDRDGDGRFDAVGLDGDGDGRIDTVALDRDGDGRFDAVGLDGDGDGRIDTVALDNDQDGSPDVIGYDTDQDGTIDEVWTDD